MPSRRLLCALPVAAAALLAIPVSSPAAQSPASEPAMQLPPDQAAFKAANALPDNRQRTAALEAFLHEYPRSTRAGRARTIVLHLLVQQQPRDEQRIHQAARARIDSAAKDARVDEENSVAYTLAEALPNGVDLKSAEAWARDAVKQTTQQKVTESVRKSYAEAKQPPPPDATLKHIFGESQAANLQTLADVYLHEGKLTEATATIEQAQQLNPDQGANFVTRAQIQHAQQQDDKALDNLIMAEVRGGMTPAATQLLNTLYAAQHGGDRSGLDAEIDRRYQATYPPVVIAQPHPSSTSSRTVLLSLYTGSACQPCVAADLAFDAVLANYPREQVVALAFDQHIPDPDPLANPATIARGDYDSVRYTPTLRINGHAGPQVGSPQRSDAAESYKTTADALEKTLRIPSGVSLHLTAALTPEHTVAATAHAEVTDPETLRALLAGKPGTSHAESSATSAEAAPADAPTTPKLVLNFALVQPEVRFSGENGIRFHRMVVRDLARLSAEAFPVQSTGATSASVRFDPAAISTSLGKYLDGFAQHSERFGTAEFLSTDTALPLNNLAVAAWVEDLTSHQVLAAAYTPLATSEPQQASR